MKTIKLVCCLLVLGFTFEAFAQETETVKLREIEMLATNYKYLNATSNREEALPVKMLQHKAASFNPENSDEYNEGNDEYIVSFTIPDGSILAAYDKNGEIMRTIERYKNIKTPTVIAKSILATYPGWTISKNIYLITYHTEKGLNKNYKFKLKKDGNTIRVKTNEDGDFI